MRAGHYHLDFDQEDFLYGIRLYRIWLDVDMRQEWVVLPSRHPASRYFVTTSYAPVDAKGPRHAPLLR